MAKAESNQKGYTLIEIVMVIVLLGIIGVVTFQVVFSGVEVFTRARDRKELYDQAKLAMERMVREIRDANQIVTPAVGSTATSINFIKAHTSPGDTSTDITFQLNGTDLERVGDVSGTVDLASSLTAVTGFQATHEGISYDNANSATATNLSTVTIANYAIGGGDNRLLVVGVAIEHNASGPTITGITYDGQALTKIDSEEIVTTYMGRAELWYLLEAKLPAAGSYNVVVTASQACENLTAGAISLAGVRQQEPEASAKSSNGGPNTITTNITTQTDDAWLVDVVQCGNVAAFTPAAGQTERYERAGASSEGAGSTKPVASAGLTSAGWTSANANRMTHVVAAFAPARMVTLDLEVSSTAGGTIPLRAKVNPRNVP